MADATRLNHPWLVAAWPGMGHVALNAGIYLLSRLGMDAFAELDGGELFDIDHVEVKQGVVSPGRRPKNRLFSWKDPRGHRDLIVFLGEAQPPLGRSAFCQQLVRFARDQGVDRVFTFAAMATAMRPEHPSRVFAAATDSELLHELQGFEMEPLESGEISGLNGVLVGAAAESGLRGACLLGEMPHIFTQLPFPKASMAVLEAFSSAAGIELDLTELAGQARAVEEQLGELLAQAEEASGRQLLGEEPEEYAVPPEPQGLDPADEQQIERLFDEAAADRAKAFELKRELDRLGVFPEYENRFLDLFRRSE